VHKGRDTRGENSVDEPFDILGGAADSGVTSTLELSEWMNTPRTTLRRKIEKYGLQGKLDAIYAENSGVAAPDVQAKIDAAEFKRVMRRNLELERKLYVREEIVGHLRQQAAKVDLGRPATRAPYRKRGDEIVVSAPLADIHVGLYGYGKELWHKQDYDTEIARDRIVQWGHEVAEFVDGLGAKVTRLHLPDLGDTMHAPTGATMHDTKLQMDTRPFKVFSETLYAWIQAIEACRPVARQIVLNTTRGNHDHVAHQFLKLALAEHYRQTPEVVTEEPDQPQTYFAHGESIHMYSHGEVFRSFGAKDKAQAEVLLREGAGEDYHGKRYLHLYVGHLHSEKVETNGRHMKIMRLPAGCPSDEYAQGLGFIHEAGARVFVLADDGRVDQTKHIYL
jgi:hypothetical protein